MTKYIGEGNKNANRSTLEQISFSYPIIDMINDHAHAYDEKRKIVIYMITLMTGNCKIITSNHYIQKIRGSIIWENIYADYCKKRNHEHIYNIYDKIESYIYNK